MKFPRIHTKFQGIQLADRTTKITVSALIRQYIERHGVVVGTLIICVVIFAGITAFTDFLTFLPFGLPKNLMVMSLLVAAITLIIRGSFSRPTSKIPTGGLEMAEITNNSGTQEQYQYQKYKYLVGRGILKFGPLRDVAVRVLSLQTILEAIVENVPDYETVLEQTGKKVGEAFAGDFQKVLDDDLALRSRNIPFTEKFKRWLKYDSKAGMGEYSGELDQNCEGEITIENSFLTYGRRTGRDKPLCAFMRGYIEGMLQGMSGSPDIKLLHPIQQGTCGFFDKDPERCVFTIQNTRIHPVESK